MRTYQAYIPQLIAYEQAWLYFLKTGEIDTTVINPVIAESWKRCKAMGLDPLAPKIDIRLSEEELKKRIAERQELVDTAWPFMQTLYKLVQGSGFRVDLVDEEGYILKIIGDEEAMAICKKTNSLLGANRSERVAGTTSMGLALITGEPIQIAGAEHYMQQFQGWTCSAAPIFDSKGKIIGVLNMGGRYELVHKHTLGMVVATAKAIENKLKVQQVAQQLARNNSQLKTTLEAISDGLLYVDKDKRITQANLVAEEILGLSAEKMIGRKINDVLVTIPSLETVLQFGQQCKNREVLLNVKQKNIRCLMTVKPILRRSNKVDGMVFILQKAEEVRQLVHKMVGSSARFTFDDIIGENAAIKEAINLAKLAAGTNSRVIIEGESGTGKELFAQAIHNASLRQHEPFVAVNCGAIPRELIESELFGYEEGAFTGARRGGQPGKFELAEGGTLFLDEIGDMPLEMQVKILRVLQENQVIRIGGRRAIPVNVRVIAATNKDLEEEVRKGNFREDLYYRLNVVKIKVPPLRQRKDDIPLLVRYFLRNSNQLGKEINDIEPLAMEIMQAYDWPGNIRELQNVIERAIVVAKGSKLTYYDLPEHICGRKQLSSTEEQPALLTMEEIEKKAIFQTLCMVNGNVTEAARILQIGRNTLYRKLEKYQYKEAVTSRTFKKAMKEARAGKS